MTFPCLIGNVFVDAVTRRNHSAPLSMTSHPVESSAKMAEFVVDEDEILTLDCTFTDDELSYYGLDDVAVHAANRYTTAADKKSAIKKIKEAKLPINVTMSDAFYQSFVLLDIQEDVTVQTSSCFKATLIFQKAKLSTLLFSNLPTDAVKKARKVTKKQTPPVDTGKVDAETVPDGSAEAEAAKQDVSLLKGAAATVTGG